MNGLTLVLGQRVIPVCVVVDETTLARAHSGRTSGKTQADHRSVSFVVSAVGGDTS
jgi:hypothetical protein